MDVSSQNVAGFLSGLQQAQERLRQLHQALIIRGCRRCERHLTLSASPFTIHEVEHTREFIGSVALGLTVRGADDREYDLVIEALWDRAGWTIQTQAWVEAEEGGLTLLRELPERFSPDLSICLVHLREATEDLFGLQSLVPGRHGATV